MYTFLTTKKTILLLYYIYTFFCVLFLTCCGRVAACLLLMQIKPLWAELNGTDTDRQTDRQTDGQTDSSVGFLQQSGWRTEQNTAHLPPTEQANFACCVGTHGGRVAVTRCPEGPTQLCRFSGNAARYTEDGTEPSFVLNTHRISNF